MPNIDSVYIDLAISLAAAFFLLSLISSAVNELIALTTRLRAKFLWSYINHLFTTAEKDAAEGTVAKEARLAMPLSPSPAPPGSDPAAEPGAAASPAAASRASTAPATGKQRAVPLPTSVGGLWRLITATSTKDPRPSAGTEVRDDEPVVERLHRQLRPIDVGHAMRGRREQDPKKKKAKSKTTVKHISATSFAQAILEVFQAADPQKPDVMSDAIDRLAGTPVHSTLQALWASSERQIGSFRQQIEDWFDAEMARLSGLYKRLTRWILALVAVLVALIVNLDPIALARDLWRDPARRSAFVEFAENATEPPDTEDTTTTTESAGTEDSTTTTEPAEDEGTATSGDLASLIQLCDVDAELGEEPPSAEDFANAIESTRSCVLDSLEAQRNLGLLSSAVFERDRFVESWKRDGLLRPLKLALVAAALTLGAPFWYDILRRLIGVRATANRRET